METARVDSTPYTNRQLGILYLGWLILGTLVFLNAWVSEDAYITFRVVDNFVNDYGLRWNTNERVQVYTHPLWMLLHIPLYSLWNNIYLVTLTLSITCTMAAFIVTLASVKKPAMTALGCLFAPLMLSKSFMDYSTSGLETPLSFLLYAIFGYVVLKLWNHRYFWFFCSLSVALALFNRLDSVFLYAPVLIWLTVSYWRQMRWGQILLGAMPIIGWLGFSLFYYGFLFPNTKYAKLDTGLGTLIYIKQGFHYLKFLTAYDTVSGIMLTCPLVIALMSIRKARWHGLPLSLALGILCYVLYIVYIGGDYMSGRFWAVPVFAATWLFYVSLPDDFRPDIPFATLCLLLAAFGVSQQLGTIRKNCSECMVGKNRIINARIVFGTNALVVSPYPLRLRKEAGFYYANDGKRLSRFEPGSVRIRYNVGLAGYYAGPGIILIDQVGLTDPLLARLPANKKHSFYIGHFRRKIPAGYLDAIKTGSTDTMAPALAEYYKKLRLMVSGDLFDPERLRTIIEFNLGKYDHFRNDFLTR